MIRHYDVTPSASTPHPTVTFDMFGRSWTPKLRLITRERVAYLSRPDPERVVLDDGSPDVSGSTIAEILWILQSIQALLVEPGLIDAAAKALHPGDVFSDDMWLDLDIAALAEWWKDAQSITLNGSIPEGEAADPTVGQSPDA
jgi:hypothetical protein